MTLAFQVPERYSDPERLYRPMPPSPQAVERMLETMRWVQWREVEQRHLVWMRSHRYRWEQIGRRFAYTARTAQQRYAAAIHLGVLHLNKGHRLKSRTLNKGRRVGGDGEIGCQNNPWRV